MAQRGLTSHRCRFWRKQEFRTIHRTDASSRPLPKWSGLVPFPNACGAVRLEFDELAARKQESSCAIGNGAVLRGRSRLLTDQLTPADAPFGIDGAHEPIPRFADHRKKCGAGKNLLLEPPRHRVREKRSAAAFGIRKLRWIEQVRAPHPIGTL